LPKKSVKLLPPTYLKPVNNRAIRPNTIRALK
jgi:hypothetical protein